MNKSCIKQSLLSNLARHPPTRCQSRGHVRAPLKPPFDATKPKLLWKLKLSGHSRLAQTPPHQTATKQAPLHPLTNTSTARRVPVVCSRNNRRSPKHPLAHDAWPPGHRRFAPTAPGASPIHRSSLNTVRSLHPHLQLCSPSAHPRRKAEEGCRRAQPSGQARREGQGEEARFHRDRRCCGQDRRKGKGREKEGCRIEEEEEACCGQESIDA
jgi:hypothetical protein